MRGWEFPGARIARRLVGLGLVLMLAAGTVACGDDDDITDVDLMDLETVAGLYHPETITFDPSGSAPTADILLALQEGDVDPSINIGKTGSFQLFYTDPATLNVVNVNGSVEATKEGIKLIFPSQSSADQFLFPRTVSLDYDEAAGSLSFSGSADVNRERLQELFPELYGEEPWTSETIPGVLTMLFVRSSD